MTEIMIEYDDHIEDVIEKVGKLLRDIGYEFENRLVEDEPILYLSLKKVY